MEWSGQQVKALDAVGRWLHSDEQVFSLHGVAGTGKTTLAKYVAATVEGRTLFAAFAGKAAARMRQVGCANASTVHSLIYKVVSDEDVAETKRLREEIRHAQPRSRIMRELRNALRRATQPHFALNPDSPLGSARLLILDEVSMIGQTMAEDLLQFGVKILTLGDPAQLPPVRGTGYFMTGQPDVMLTEIHRQALDNPILRMATMARRGERLPFVDWGAARKIHREDLSTSWLVEQGAANGEMQILCGLNETRRRINRNIRRRIYGDPSPYPLTGDKLICLKNRAELGLLNGVQAWASSPAMDDSDSDALIVPMKYGDEGLSMELTVSRVPFEVYDNPALEGTADYGDEQFDFAYSQTTHKAQGSEWPSIVFCDDWKSRDYARLLYTAITRAQERLLIAE